MKSHPTLAIRQALGSYFPNAVVHPLDDEYALLTERAWASMHQLFSYSMLQREQPEWVKDKGDCDDWAWLFRSYIIERNWQQSESKLPIALYYLHYTTRKGERHAINAAIVRRGDVLAVLPFEPLPNGGGPFEMTRAERESCTLLIG